MLTSIIRSSLKNRLLVVAVAVVVMIFGLMQVRDMPLDAYPEFSPPYVEIQTEALGLSAEEVEQLITVPLEADLLNGVPWLKTIRSESIPGLSSVVLIFENGTDLMRARQMVQERLTQAHALPQVSKPPVMLQPLSSTSRVMTVGLTSTGLSHIDMSVLARWTVKPRLMGVSGVANVSIWGQRKRQLQVQVDPETLQEKNLTLHQVIKTTGNALWVSPLTFLDASTPGTGGWIDTPNQRLAVRHLLPITHPEDLAQVIVEGTNMPLGSVATVVEDHQPLIGDAMINEEPGLLLVVEKFPWANTLEVTQGVEKAMSALSPAISGMEYDTQIFRPATYIETAMNNIGNAMFIGGLIMAVVLMAFLFNWRSGVVSLFSLSTSLLAAGSVLYLQGITINMMVLAGLVVALGIIIDDAVIDIENIVRRIRQYRQAGDDKSTAMMIFETSLEMRRPIAYAAAIMALVVLPAFAVQGLSGAFLQPVAIAYLIAMGASFLVALTVTPALTLLIFSKAPLQETDAPVGRTLQGIYDRACSWSIQTGRGALIAVAVLLVAGVALYPKLGQESLVPTLKETDLLVKWEGTPGTSRQAMNRLATRVTRELRAIPGVRDVSANVGRAELSDQVVGINASEIWVSIDPAADYEATREAIRDTVDGYPGVNRSVLTFLQNKTREKLTGAEEPLIVRLYGHELKVLNQNAQVVKQALKGIRGLDEVHLETQISEPTLEIKVDLERSERYGIKPGDVRRAASALLAGIEVGSLFEEQKVFDVVVYGTPQTRHSLTSINNLVIDTPRGGYVKLKDVADVTMVRTPNVIDREAVQRYVDIGLEISGDDHGSVALEVEHRLKALQFPIEYHAEVLGAFADRQLAQKEALWFTIAAGIAIILLLQVCLGSWSLASVVVLTGCASLVGGVFAAFAGGAILSIGSLLGFIAVLGIAVRNSIVLIKHYQHLELKEGQTPGPELVQRGTGERMASILTTAFTTGLTFLPFVLAGNIAGYEILNPMGIVVLGGLVSSTLVTVFVIPALYLGFGADSKEVLMEQEAYA